MRHLFYILVALAVMCGAVACGKKHSPNKPKANQRDGSSGMYFHI